MENGVKMKYMGRQVIGSSEYMAKTFDALKENVVPIKGDIGRTADGKEYFCWTAGTWEEMNK